MTISSKNGRMDSSAAAANASSLRSRTTALSPGFFVEPSKSFHVKPGR